VQSHTARFHQRLSR